MSLPFSFLKYLIKSNMSILLDRKCWNNFEPISKLHSTISDKPFCYVTYTCIQIKNHFHHSFLSTGLQSNSDLCIADVRLSVCLPHLVNFGKPLRLSFGILFAPGHTVLSGSCFFEFLNTCMIQKNNRMKFKLSVNVSCMNFYIFFRIHAFNPKMLNVSYNVL